MSITSWIKKLLKPKYKVVRTVWPYPDGWGVVLSSVFEPDTVVVSGLSRTHAEAHKNDLVKLANHE